MEAYQLGAIETRFAKIIWSSAPMTTRQLVEACEKELNWKRPTTYSILKKLSEKGFFKMEDKVVTVLMTEEEYQARQSERFVEENFQGSLPALVLSFGSRKKLSEDEIRELEQVIRTMREETP